MHAIATRLRHGLPLVLIPTILGAAPAQLSAQDGEESEGLPLPVDRYLDISTTESTWMSVDVSPDGRTIVFDHLGNLFTLPIDGGQATQLTSGLAFDAQPRFSPDGEHIVFTSDMDGGQNIWVMSLDGTVTIQVSEGEANR